MEAEQDTTPGDVWRNDLHPPVTFKPSVPITRRLDYWVRSQLLSNFLLPIHECLLFVIFPKCAVVTEHLIKMSHHLSKRIQRLFSSWLNSPLGILRFFLKSMFVYPLVCAISFTFFLKASLGNGALRGGEFMSRVSEVVGLGKTVVEIMEKLPVFTLLTAVPRTCPLGCGFWHLSAPHTPSSLTLSLWLHIWETCG